MLLRRSLPSPANPGVTTDRHHAGPPLRRIDAISSFSLKPPNPLRLNLFLSAGCPRNEIRQTHWGYLACFKVLIAKNGPFFCKKLMVPVFVVSNYRRRGRRRPSQSAAPERGEQFRNETCTRTKLECGVESVACLAILPVSETPAIPARRGRADRCGFRGAGCSTASEG